MSVIPSETRTVKQRSNHYKLSGRTRHTTDTTMKSRKLLDYFFIFLWLFHSFVFLNVKMQKWNSKVTHDISMRNCSLQIASNHSLMRPFLQSCGAAMIRLDYRPRCPHLISKYHTLTGPPLKDSPQVKTSSINIRPLCEDCSSCQFKQNIKVWLQGGEKNTQLKHKGNAETIPLHFCWRKAIKERKTEQQNSKS